MNETGLWIALISMTILWLVTYILLIVQVNTNRALRNWLIQERQQKHGPENQEG